MDCLHIRSGLPKHLIIEQHGNCHKEVCVNCGLEHWRAFDVGSTVLKTREHFTFRNCRWCGGKLRDTIVHFSENWSEQHTEVLSLHHAHKCDLAIIMGTSMNVQPNATFPELCLKNPRHPEGKLVLINLQKTPYDNLANIRIFTKTDLFMFLLMSELGLAKFDTDADCRVGWDEMKEEDMERYYKEAYGYQKTEEVDEGEWWEKIAMFVPVVMGTGVLALKRLVG